MAEGSELILLRGGIEKVGEGLPISLKELRIEERDYIYLRVAGIARSKSEVIINQLHPGLERFEVQKGGELERIERVVLSEPGKFLKEIEEGIQVELRILGEIIKKSMLMRYFSWDILSSIEKIQVLKVVGMVGKKGGKKVKEGEEDESYEERVHRMWKKKRAK